MSSGSPEEICGAWITKKQRNCGLARGWGTTHPGFGTCKWHFGNTTSGKLAAAKETGLKMLKYTSPIEVDPTQAMLQELYRTAGMVKWLDGKISKWELDTDEEIPDSQKQWMSVHREERKHMVHVARSALLAGIAEREIKLAEQQGAILADAIDKILGRLNLTAAQLDLIPEIVPPVLRAVSVRIDQKELSASG